MYALAAICPGLFGQRTIGHSRLRARSFGARSTLRLILTAAALSVSFGGQTALAQQSADFSQTSSTQFMLRDGVVTLRWIPSEPAQAPAALTPTPAARSMSRLTRLELAVEPTSGATAPRAELLVFEDQVPPLLQALRAAAPLPTSDGSSRSLLSLAEFEWLLGRLPRQAEATLLLRQRPNNDLIEATRGAWERSTRLVIRRARWLARVRRERPSARSRWLESPLAMAQIVRLSEIAGVLPAFTDRNQAPITDTRNAMPDIEVMLLDAVASLPPEWRDQVIPRLEQAALALNQALNGRGLSLGDVANRRVDHRWIELTLSSQQLSSRVWGSLRLTPEEARDLTLELEGAVRRELGPLVDRVQFEFNRIMSLAFGSGYLRLGAEPIRLRNHRRAPILTSYLENLDLVAVRYRRLHPGVQEDLEFWVPRASESMLERRILAAERRGGGGIEGLQKLADELKRKLRSIHERESVFRRQDLIGNRPDEVFKRYLESQSLQPDTGFSAAPFLESSACARVTGASGSGLDGELTR